VIYFKILNIMSSRPSQLSSAQWRLAVGPLSLVCRKSELEFGVYELGTPTPSRFYLFVLFYVREMLGARDGAVVEALRYKPKGRGIDSRWCHWNFSLT
jgi:hypothetical protein